MRHVMSSVLSSRRYYDTPGSLPFVFFARQDVDEQYAQTVVGAPAHANDFLHVLVGHQVA